MRHLIKSCIPTTWRIYQIQAIKTKKQKVVFPSVSVTCHCIDTTPLTDSLTNVEIATAVFLHTHTTINLHGPHFYQNSVRKYAIP